MENPENDLKPFYSASINEELQKEIATNKISPGTEAPHVNDRVEQKSVASRIAILKGLAVKYQG